MEPKIKAYSYIRFSTPEQAKGDSLRRQLELSRKYAEAHNLILDETMQDLGLSAFHGKHKSKGTLGRFLDLIEEGMIPPGSVLLVENLDRLSREQPLTALSQFINIIQAGIKLVTLQNNQEYTKENLNEGQLYLTVGEIIRANKESERKSYLLGKAWSNKREKAMRGEIKLTSKAPLWLKLSKDRKSFSLIPEARKTIELIFTLKLSGMGIGRIEKELNRRADVWVPPYNPKRKTIGWRASYISKILNSRAVIGEFTPHHLKDDKRRPETPIAKYFPKAIDEDLFNNVQAQLRTNRGLSGHSGGRTGQATNLFVHLVYCGFCGAPMHLIDKGAPPKGAKYLHCDKSRRTGQCEAKAVRYYEFERIFFENFEELNVSDLLPDQNELQKHRTNLQQKLVSNNQQLFDIEEQIENITDSIGKTKDERVRQKLEDSLIKIFDEKDKLIGNNQIIEKELSDLESEMKSINSNIDTTKEVYGLLKGCKDSHARISFRLKLREEIRKLIRRIDIYPLKQPYKKVQEIDYHVYQFMDSKYIDKIRISFKGSIKTKVLFLKSTGEPDY
jgi:DNA invertase Pin-like site-specific DNA recombinase